MKNDPVQLPGVWGLYNNAMVPGTWLNDGGQSAAGAALDRLTAIHPATPDVRVTAQRQGFLSSPIFQDRRWRSRA
nr:FGGY-family carbohydrate kinase [Pelagibacterium luteolum]